MGRRLFWVPAAGSLTSTTVDGPLCVPSGVRIDLRPLASSRNRTGHGCLLGDEVTGRLVNRAQWQKQMHAGEVSVKAMGRASASIMVAVYKCWLDPIRRLPSA